MAGGPAGAGRDTIGAVLARARRRLRAGGLETPELDARLLLGDALGLDTAGLVLRAGDPVPADLGREIERRLDRRLAGEPVHRILGRRFFYDHEFALSPDTLEPRPDTETLVDLAREAVRRRVAATGACRFADLGTGSGAIAVSLLAAHPETEALGIDLSLGALRTARRNAEAAGVGRRFHALLGDFLAPVGNGVDLAVSNPPYVPAGDIRRLDRGVRDFDPRLALDGGADGLDAYRRIAGDCGRWSGGDVLVEIGAGQEQGVARLFATAGFGLHAARADLAGTLRALWFRRDTPEKST